MQAIRCVAPHFPHHPFIARDAIHHLYANTILLNLLLCDPSGFAKRLQRLDQPRATEVSTSALTHTDVQLTNIFPLPQHLLATCHD